MATRALQCNGHLCLRVDLRSHVEAARMIFVGRGVTGDLKVRAEVLFSALLGHDSDLTRLVPRKHMSRFLVGPEALPSCVQVRLDRSRHFFFELTLCVVFWIGREPSHRRSILEHRWGRWWLLFLLLLLLLLGLRLRLL